jgi:hypothetical protein
LVPQVFENIGSALENGCLCESAERQHFGFCAPATPLSDWARRSQRADASAAFASSGGTPLRAARGAEMAPQGAETIDSAPGSGKTSAV